MRAGAGLFTYGTALVAAAGSPPRPPTSTKDTKATGCRTSPLAAESIRPLAGAMGTETRNSIEHGSVTLEPPCAPRAGRSQPSDGRGGPDSRVTACPVHRSLVTLGAGPPRPSTRAFGPRAAQVGGSASWWIRTREAANDATIHSAALVVFVLFVIFVVAPQVVRQRDPSVHPQAAGCASASNVLEWTPAPCPDEFARSH